MRLSTKCRYGLRAMIDLALFSGRSHVALRDIADRQEISLKYLEQDFSILKRSGLIRSVKGAQGGYLLARPAEDISLYDIIIAMERTIKLNRCLEHDAFCSSEATGYCLVHSIYEDLQGDMERTLRGHSVADILRGAKHPRISEQR